MPRLRTLCLVLAGLIVAAALAGACDDDDDGADATPTATAAAVTAPAASPSPRPTIAITPGATPGPPVTIELSADPAELICDGSNPSIITAFVLDDAGQPVADGTRVNFSVVTLGSVDPVNAETTAGEATTTLTALAQGVGVVINVTADDAEGSLRVDCL
jgi:hypothetical protein